jgi:hypothetical protein
MTGSRHIAHTRDRSPARQSHCVSVLDTVLSARWSTVILPTYAVAAADLVLAIMKWEEILHVWLLIILMTQPHSSGIDVQQFNDQETCETAGAVVEKSLLQMDPHRFQGA